MEEAFGRLYLQSFSFGYYPNLRTLGEGRTGKLTSELRALSFNWALSSPQQTSAESTWLQMLHQSACPSPFFPHSWTRPQVLELLHLEQDLLPDPEKAHHLSPAKNHGLRFGGADSHPGRFTLRYKTDPARDGGHGLMKLTGPHHLQRA